MGSFTVFTHLVSCHDHGEQSNTKACFCACTGLRLIWRGDNSQRVHDGVLENYYDIMMVDGLVPGVGGLPRWAKWLPADGVAEVYFFSYGTRCRAFYLAKQRYPENSTK